MSTLTLLSLVAYVVTVAIAWTVRSRPYGLSRAVSLGIHLLIALPLFPEAAPWRQLLLYCHVAVFVDALALAVPRSRGVLYRTFVSFPAHYLTTSTLLAWPWAVAAAFGLPLYLLPLPYVLGALGFIQSLVPRRELVLLQPDPRGSPEILARLPGRRRLARGSQAPEGTLSVAQITDPHIGPFMSPARLNRISQRIVEQDPDLVLLTGDFLTMESQTDPNLLLHGLAPLAALEGRVFSCMGNHDHEAPLVVHKALSGISARLLVDEATVVRTRLGPVEIVGLDFHFTDRDKKIPEILARLPRTPGLPRLMMLHDPGGFRYVPSGAADVVFSGHTHGGQVGLVSFGLPLTMVSWLTKIPDHGLWGLGRNLLYVHRGTGHYGFPFRLGVPAEESLLFIPLPQPGAA